MLLQVILALSCPKNIVLSNEMRYLQKVTMRNDLIGLKEKNIRMHFFAGSHKILRVSVAVNV